MVTALRFFFALLLLLCFACDREQEKIVLFDDYYYGMTANEVKERSQAVPCVNSLDSLCRKNAIPFFKESWFQRFNFRRNRLISVDLIHLTPAKVTPLINPWLDSGRRFVPVLVQSGGRTLDLFAAMKTAGKEGARRAFLAFNRATATDLENTYLYLDLAGREDCLDAMNSYHAILAYGPIDLIGVQESVSDSECILTFMAPVAEWRNQHPK